MATLDQEYTSGSSEVTIEGTGLNAIEGVAQGVILGATGLISQVKVYLKKNGSPTGNIVCEIYSDNGSNKPSTLISDSQSIACSSIETSATEYTFSFTTKPNKNSTEKIHIYIRKDSAISAGNTIAIIADGAGTYPTMYLNRRYNSDWTSAPLTGYDAKFKEYYELPTVSNATFLLKMI